MSFDVERLLGSRRFSFTTEHTKFADQTYEEFAIWQDPSGPLRLCRIASDNATHYRLYLDEDVAIDLLPNRHLMALACPNVSKITIDHFVADQVLPRLISQDGEFVLHSGAVQSGDGAILLLGASGLGKSTLATSFHRDGWSLIGDDAVIISAGEVPTAEAIYASLRLFPDSIAALLPEDVAFEEIAHYSDKQRVSVSIVTDNEPTSVPIRAIFVLNKPSLTEIDITRLSIADSCMAILENSFALDPTDAERARHRLVSASDLAKRVPAFSLSYPRNYALLPDVRSAILSELGVL